MNTFDNEVAKEFEKLHKEKRESFVLGMFFGGFCTVVGILMGFIINWYWI